jgi:uncharacterized protein YjgD (DUF1641 family)
MTTLARPDVDERFDLLSQQVQLLVDEAEDRRRLRESLTDLMSDLNPVAAQGMGTVTRVMAEAENRGYIQFAKGGAGVVDRIVTSFSEEDIEALGDNVVLILETVKEMTQPELMQMMRSTLHTVQEIDEPSDPPSLFAIARELREPEVRRGLARMIALLRGVGTIDQNEVQKGKEARN